jgi:hypothetical protein
MLRVLTVSIGALALLAGCVAPGMGGWSVQRQISGGTTVVIQFDKGNPAQADDAEIHVTKANLEIDPKTKKCDYRFGFVEKTGKRPTRVLIEDVSDDTPLTWAEDNHPQLDRGGLWQTTTAKFDPNDGRLAWLEQIDDTLRIFRFTVDLPGGDRHVLYQGMNFPAVIKRIVRIQMGMEPAPTGH